MKKIYLVDENLNEFAGRRGRPRKVKEPEGDNWYSADDEFDAPEAGPEQIEDVELEDEVTDVAVLKQLTKRLENELAAPEFNRGALKFRIRSSGERVSGVPMAKMGGGFLFKTPNGMKKVKVEDMIIESKKEKKFVGESFKDYE
jgi:hypothetical protein